MGNTRDKSINIRVTEAEKQKIDQIAKSVGTDVSSLMRETVLTEEKLILLPSGPEIASKLCELITDIQRIHKPEALESVYWPVLLKKVEEVSDQMQLISDKLSEISGSPDENADNADSDGGE